MFLTVHAAAGALIGEQSSSALLAFLLGLISHFLLDLIPHGDEKLVEGYYNGERIKRMITAASLDGIIMVIFIMFWFNKGIFMQPGIVMWGIIGGILPDLFVGSHEISNKRLFKTIYNFHFKNHNHLLKKIKMPLSFGTFLQIGILVILNIIIF